MTSKSFSVRIFLQDGHAGGVKIIAKSKWNGRALVIPRKSLIEEISREELNVPGVYVLVGNSPEGNMPTIYIGACDPVCRDLEQHSYQKNFWNWVVVFASKDNSLNQAHVQYFESRLIQLAQKAKRSNLENQSDPQCPNLSEIELVDSESFLAHILSICPLFGLTIFEPEVSCDH